jgi:hypothetical protein
MYAARFIQHRICRQVNVIVCRRAARFESSPLWRNLGLVLLTFLQPPAASSQSSRTSTSFSFRSLNPPSCSELQTSFVYDRSYDLNELWSLCASSADDSLSPSAFTDFDTSSCRRRVLS